MSTNLSLNIEVLHHDAVAAGKSAQLLVECLKISDGPLAAAADAVSRTAWDVVANLDVALRATP
jgi:hypothetical protein